MSNHLLLEEILPFTSAPEIETSLEDPVVSDTQSFAMADGTIMTLNSIDGYTYLFGGLDGYERVSAGEVQLNHIAADGTLISSTTVASVRNDLRDTVVTAISHNSRLARMVCRRPI
ncbi:hypothetical protein [Salipiger abyssi]|uniref:hypothetical protein n=1 Tax=Salipiger abyssi TaxID=1250539 RepID=UPI000978BDA7|nr:hypothetical protein [Salipiger abyssi]